MTEAERTYWVNKEPKDILIHGPSKLYIDKYLWFHPEDGIISSYKAQAKDVADHFDVFRGVDIIESAGQTAVSACAILESIKQDKTIDELKKHFRIAFFGMGEARFYDFVRVDETLLNICTIKKYKFRRVLASCKVYKAKAGTDIAKVFSRLTVRKTGGVHIPGELELVAVLNDMSGGAIPINKIYTN